MRSLVYFLPPRTSVTASVGMSTRPIFSCRPNAATRDSSGSFTLRSTPEWEWMMYHFMFGLRGGSMPCGTAAAACSAASEFRFFVSSSIVFDKIAPICRLAVREVAQDLVNAPPDNGVHNPEVGSEQENGDYHHPGRRLHLFQ